MQDTTFSGDDWALEEVAHVRYEDCAFHPVLCTRNDGGVLMASP